MQKQLYFAGSSTKAIKIRNILRKNGIKADIERSFDSTNAKGCGYAVVVIDSDVKKANEIINRFLGDESDESVP